MNTERTLNEIECALAKYFDIRRNIIVCNVSWGLLNHEADMVVLSPSGYLTEIEIKRSISDLRADFKKEHDHSDKCLKYFYYCVPKALKDECEKLINDHCRYVTAIITYDEKLNLSIEPVHYSHSGRDFITAGRELGGRKLFLEEQLQIARLGSMRAWGLKNKQLENKNGSIELQSS